MPSEPLWTSPNSPGLIIFVGKGRLQILFLWDAAPAASPLSSPSPLHSHHLGLKPSAFVSSQSRLVSTKTPSCSKGQGSCISCTSTNTPTSPHLGQKSGFFPDTGGPSVKQEHTRCWVYSGTEAQDARLTISFSFCPF